MKMSSFGLYLFFFISIILSGLVFGETKVFQLTLRNHLFFPAELEIPAGEKVKLVIHNQDKLAEEFDSFDLNREKVIFAGQKSTIYIGPLSPGEYHFFGEYNPNTATGVIKVKGDVDAD